MNQIAYLVDSFSLIAKNENYNKVIRVSGIQILETLMKKSPGIFSKEKTEELIKTAFYMIGSLETNIEKWTNEDQDSDISKNYVNMIGQELLQNIAENINTEIAQSFFLLCIQNLLSSSE